MTVTAERQQLDLDALRSFLSSVGTSVGSELIVSPSRRLFHYTDLSALVGIIQQDDIWLTHARYSNDEEEMTLGQRVAFEVVSQALSEAIDDRRRAHLERVKALIDAPTVKAVYIWCFCAKDNLLSQWRGYGANGTGVSVEIDSEGFGPLAGVDCPNGVVRLFPVLYDRATQSRCVRSALDFDFARTPGESDTMLAQRAADAIQFFIPTFKNADFAEETEWRLIFTPNPGFPVPPRFRASRNLLVPYFPLAEAAGTGPPPQTGGSRRIRIVGVTVGQGVNKAVNVESVTMLLEQAGYRDLPVRASQTPFRG
jgi:hypothetical protein